MNGLKAPEPPEELHQSSWVVEDLLHVRVVPSKEALAGPSVRR